MYELIMFDLIEIMLQGEKGDPGAAGVPGKLGMPGRDGLPGKDGINGTDGLPGFNGMDGKDGEMGPPVSNSDLWVQRDKVESNLKTSCYIFLS